MLAYSMYHLKTSSDKTKNKKPPKPILFNKEFLSRDPYSLGHLFFYRVFQPPRPEFGNSSHFVSFHQKHPFQVIINSVSAKLAGEVEKYEALEPGTWVEVFLLECG